MEENRCKERAEDAKRALEWREENSRKAEARERQSAGRDVPKLATLEDPGELESTSFETQMTLYDVHHDYWLAHLVPILDSTSRLFRKTCRQRAKTTSLQ